jgi:ubiquinone/menaquinone biosynthesis C-methylase UbiE
MWQWLNRFEGLLFLIPFLIYASLRHVSYYTRCKNCAKLLINYGLLHGGLCEKCLKERLRSNPAQVYDQRSEVGASLVNYGEGHLYRAVAEKVGKGRVLDVGCGRATLLFRLSSQGRELHGIDIARQALKRIKTLHEGINFYLGDVRNLPFKTDTFDYLVCIETLEHIAGDELVRDCFRVLKPGGSALFTIPSGKGISGNEPEHLRLFNFQSFISFLKGAGFDIITGRKFGLYIPLVTRLFGALAAALDRDLPLSHPLNISLPEPLASHFLAECRKPGQYSRLPAGGQGVRT